MRGVTTGKVLACIELAAISDTVGRMWRHGSRQPQRADEADPAMLSLAELEFSSNAASPPLREFLGPISLPALILESAF